MLGSSGPPTVINTNAPASIPGVAHQATVVTAPFAANSQYQRVIPIEPASITLELLGINIQQGSTQQGKRFTFSDDQDDQDDLADDYVTKIDSGPSPQEEEAFEDARSMQFSLIRPGN